MRTPAYDESTGLCLVGRQSRPRPAANRKAVAWPAPATTARAASAPRTGSSLSSRHQPKSRRSPERRRAKNGSRLDMRRTGLPHTRRRAGEHAAQHVDPAERDDAKTATYPRITALGLTDQADVALNRRPATSKVGFLFMLNSTDKVHCRAHPSGPPAPPSPLGEGRDPLNRVAAAGRNTGHLSGHRTAPAGPLPPDADPARRPGPLDRLPHQLSGRLQPRDSSPAARRGAERHEAGGQGDRAVLPLAVLEQRDDRPPDGDGGAVERVRRLRAPARRRIADVQAAGLVVGRVRAGGQLAVALLARAARPRSRTSWPRSCRGR